MNPMNTTRETPEEVPLLNAKPRAFPSKRIIYAIIGVLALIICIAVFYSPLSRKQSQSISPWEEHATKKEDNDSGEDIERVLYTDNPNDYFCDPDFLYYDVNENPSLYEFACRDITGLLECNAGYKLNCVVSATYGNSAGSCDEDIVTPYGCGFKYEDGAVTCRDDRQCIGEHSGAVEECYNLLTSDFASTNSPCIDCMPICQCGGSSPQFYNVADCFGDKTSTICINDLDDGQSAVPNLYLPQSLWEEYCEGETACTLKLGNKHTECEGNVYYSSVMANGKGTAAFVGNGYSPTEVIELFADDDCQAMDLKVLAICEKGN